MLLGKDITNKQDKTQVTTIPSCITNGWKRKMVPFEKKFVYLIGLLVMCIQSHWHPNNLLILLIHPGYIGTAHVLSKHRKKSQGFSAST